MHGEAYLYMTRYGSRRCEHRVAAVKYLFAVDSIYGIIERVHTSLLLVGMKERDLPVVPRRGAAGKPAIPQSVRVRLQADSVMA